MGDFDGTASATQLIVKCTMSSGFVSETELAEIRQRRQEEWEKVRSLDQPLERPEEPSDGRSLYERLKEQKTKKDMEYEEANKLKNLIRGLDDDEVEFLEIVDKNKMDMEKKQILEEEQELNDYRKRVASLQIELMDKGKIKNKSKAQVPNARPSQKTLLGVGIKRKIGEAEASASGNESKRKFLQNGRDLIETDVKKLACLTTDKFDKGYFKCVAVLPGLGSYNESSDSEVSSGSEDEPVRCNDQCNYDLLGRKNEKKKHIHNSD